MSLEDLKDKIPSVEELVRNGKEVAETYEKNPTGSFVWIILVISFSSSITFGILFFKAQSKLNSMAEKAFDQALMINLQEKVINVQSEAINETTQKIETDSMVLIKVKPENIK